MFRTALCALALVSLAACGDGKEGSSFSINSSSSDGNAAGASIDGNGEAVIDTPFFKGKLSAAGFTLSDKGNGLTGKTDESKPFTLDLTPDGPGKSNGVITVE